MTLRYIKHIPSKTVKSQATHRPCHSKDLQVIKNTQPNSTHLSWGFSKKCQTRFGSKWSGHVWTVLNYQHFGFGADLNDLWETWGFNAGWLCRTMIHIQKASCQIRFHCRSQYSSWVCKKNLVLHWAWHGVTEPPGTCIYYHLWSFRIYDRAIFSHWLLLSVVPKIFRYTARKNHG